MTSTPFPPGAAGPDEHPEVTEISALSEGLLPAERQADLRAHLADCALCADVQASLEEIRETLGTLPGPSRMPEDIAGRIDAALAAEALLDATVPENTTADDAAGSDEALSDAASSGEDVSDADASEDAVSRETADPREPADGSQGFTADADKGVGLTKTPAAVSRETPRAKSADRPAGRASGSTGPGRGDRRSNDRRRTRRWRTATLVAAASVAVLGIAGVSLQAFRDTGSVQVSSGPAEDTARNKTTGLPAPSGAPDSAGSGGSTDDQQLRQRVQSLLSDGKSAPPSESGADSGADEKSDKRAGSPSIDTKQSPSEQNTLREDKLGDAGAFPSCVREAIGRSETPIAVDEHATYENQTGYLVVLPHQGGDQRRVDAYVVDPTCVTADPPSGPGKVLLKRTFPRG